MKRIVSITEQIIEDLKAERAGREPSRKTPNCLVVEDDDNDAELTSVALSAMGVEVAVVDSAEKALQLLELSKDPLRPNYDFIFIDLKLQGKMSGLDLLRRMKIQFPKVHMVIVSGYLNSPEMHTFLNEGKNIVGYIGMISKPLEKMDVKEILEKHSITER